MIYLIKKDFIRLMKSPWGNLGMMAIPLIIALVLGAAFGGENAGTPRVDLVIENHDDSWVSSIYTGAFNRDEMNELFDAEIVSENARSYVESNQVSAAIIIPENFGSDLLNGKQTEITVVKNPARRISPVIAETAIEIMNSSLSQLRVVFDKPLTQLNNEFSTDADTTDTAIAAISVMISQEMRSVGQYIFPPAIKLELIEKEEEISEEKEDPNIYLFFFPGLILLGIFFVAEAYMSDLLEEQRLGTLQRTLAAGIQPLQVMTAKVVGCIIYCCLSILLMRLIGYLLFKVPFGNIIGEMLTLFSTALAMTGIMCLVFGVARNERQGSIFSTVIVLTMSLMGGSMFPRHMLPENLKRLGVFTPNYWSLEAWDSLLIYGESISAIINPILILLAIGIVSVTIGTYLLTGKLSGLGGRS